MSCKVRLSDLISIKHGFAFKGEFFKDYPTSYILTTPGNFAIGGGFKNDKYKYYDGSIPIDYVLKENDLIVTMTDLSKQADTLGYSALVPNISGATLLHNQRIGLIEFHSDKIDKIYLYFLLRSPSYRHHVVSSATGSTVKHTSPTKILSFEFELPELGVQKLIAKNLLALEQKITLNRQINQTLEAMAQALFKSWFVDFEPVKAKMAALASGGNDEDANLAAMSAISGKSAQALLAMQTNHPEQYQQLYATAELFPSEMVESELGEIPKGWEVKSFGDVIEFQNGCAFKSEELTEDSNQGTHKVFKMGNIVKGGGFNRNGSKDYFDLNKSPKNERYLIKKGDLLMCMTDMKNNVALLGHTALMPVSDQYLVNQRVALIRKSKAHYLNYPFLYYQTNDSLFLLDLRSRANSGVQVNLSTSAIKETRILVPSKEIHEVFHAQVANYLEQIFCNDEEAQNLKDIRDALLPKLLSGELLVNGVVQ